MIVNQTGGGSGGDKLTKVVKTFSDVHSSSQYEHPTVHFNVSKAVQPGELLFQPTGGYADSSGATYVSRNEIWFTKEG